MSPASENVIPVNPAMLRWARENFGLSLADVAGRAKISPLPQKNLDPVERLRLIESGAEPVTEGIIKKLANIYRLPEIVFFLSAPPKQNVELLDYRTVGSHAPVDTPEFSALKRRVINLRDALREIALKRGDAGVSFVKSVNLPVSPYDLAAKITETFGANPCATIRGSEERKLFDALREQAQQRGVYICQIGDLGHHSSKVGVDEFRGMAISDPLAPLIVINPNDTDKASVFTLVHEFAHLLLGMSGFSDTCQHRHGKDTEKLCNAAAAEYLLPQEKCLQMLPADADEADIRELARHFKVSDTVAARRALDLGKIPPELYEAIAQRAVLVAKKDPSGKPNPNVVVRSRMGVKVTRTMFDAAMNGIISFGTAASLLGISISRLQKVCS